MKSKTLMALAVAGTFACGGAFAGGGMHGKHGSAHEAITPSSVNESAPWLANLPHSAGWFGNGQTHTASVTQDFHSDVGASSSVGGSGSLGFDSTSMSSSGYELSGLDYTLGDSGGVDYWLLGSDSFGTGASSSLGGSGFVGFDSLSSFSSSQSFDSADMSSEADQYIAWGPLSELDAGDLVAIEDEVDSSAPFTIAELPEGYTLLTPIYDEMADASSFGIDSSYTLSEYSPLGSDEDSST